MKTQSFLILRTVTFFAIAIPVFALLRWLEATNRIAIQEQSTWLAIGGLTFVFSTFTTALIFWPRQTLKFFASLKLTVLLLCGGMLIVFAGTLAQREHGIWQVMETYFRCWVAYVPIQNLLPFVSYRFPHWAQFMFPGGYTLVVIMLVNLLAAHAVRFRFVKGDLLLLPILGAAVWATYQAQAEPSTLILAVCAALLLIGLGMTVAFHLKRSGVIVIHFSLMLLLVGEIVTGMYQDEAQMPITEGQTANYVQDVRHFELAVIDPSDPNVDKHVVVSEDRLAKGGTVEHAALPFAIKIDQFSFNAEPVGPNEQRAQTLPKATAGAGAEMSGIGLAPKDRVAGVKQNEADVAGAYVTPVAGGKPLGTYLLSIPVWQDERIRKTGDPQPVKVADAAGNEKTYLIQLRYVRTYKPYMLTLREVAHDKYVGTETARNYHSKVRLVDAAKGVDREVTIRMNEPLRYAGEAFFQANVVGTDTTVLQVVKNPGWLVPYIACGLGAIGLLMHFGMHLIKFLSRREGVAVHVGSFLNPMTWATLVVNLVRNPPAKPVEIGGVGTSAKSKSTSRGGVAPDRYTLKPAGGGIWAFWVPVGVTILALIYTVGHAFQGTYKSKAVASGGVDLDALSAVPVSFDGRTMPLDSVARGSLKILSGRESIKLPDDTKVQAIEWLADTFADNPRASEYKVFRVDHPQLKGLLGLPPEEKLFSRAQIAEAPGNLNKIITQRRQAAAVESEKRDPYQKAVISLYDHLSYYERLAKAPQMAAVGRALASDETGPRMAMDVARFALFMPPDQRREQDLEAFHAAGDQAMRSADPVGRAYYQNLRTLDSVINELGRAENRRINLYFGAPLRPDGQWQPLARQVYAQLLGRLDERLAAAGSDQVKQVFTFVRQRIAANDAALAESDTGPLTPALGTWFTMLNQLQANKVTDFNATLASYRQTIDQQAPASANRAVGFEKFFNRFDPFIVAIAFYIGALLMGIGSWLGFSRPLLRGGVAFLAAAIVLQTFGLIARMYISGRPPVTNLYSSAVFIGWAGAAICLVLELIYKNGIPTVSAGVAGFATLLIAGALDVREADTMGQLQAVLDTNFWLATHVVIVTLGYVACIVAGVIAAVYVILGVLTPVLDATGRKEVARMVYGVVCFGLLASFVGTILGGIWADQSWGRFWGWDPKENGAILIVLWCAIILHARWGGIVKERGVMLLCVGAVIVTGWSWFGTNLMGVGLHAYGFIDGGVAWLLASWVACLAIIGMGLTPLARWKSIAGEAKAVPMAKVAASTARRNRQG